ncbi:MAG: thiamine phosphate synthase [Nocardioidaceae bacterium]
MLPRIHCITDIPSTQGETLAFLSSVCGAGVDAVQVRAKHLTDRELLALTGDVVATVRPLGATVLVNDRVDVALAAGADGVHLGLDDLPVAAARALAPDGFLVGGTCRSAEHAHAAVAEGADYAGVGPVFSTTTKRGLPAPVGLGVLAEAAAVLPAIAIAGLTTARVPAVLAAGADGVAVGAALSRAPDPAKEARALVAAVRVG